jgi:hypothetical protein
MTEAMKAKPRSFASAGEAARVAIEAEQRIRLLELELAKLTAERNAGDAFYRDYMARTAAAPEATPEDVEKIQALDWREPAADSGQDVEAAA